MENGVENSLTASAQLVAKDFLTTVAAFYTLSFPAEFPCEIPVGWFFNLLPFPWLVSFFNLFYLVWDLVSLSSDTNRENLSPDLKLNSEAPN